MRSRLFNLMAFFSLALLIGTVALWVRSYDAADFWLRDVQGENCGIESASGEIGWVKYRGGAFDARVPWAGLEPQWQHYRTEKKFRCVSETLTIVPSFYSSHLLVRLGFVVGIDQYLDTYSDLGASCPLAAASVPHYFLCAVFSVPPLIAIGRLAKNRRRRRAGCCGACGYNLTANISGICPECGSKVPA